jgi:hypothetical protein
MKILTWMMNLVKLVLMNYKYLGNTDFEIEYKDNTYRLSFGDAVSVNVTCTRVINETTYELSCKLEVSKEGEWTCTYIDCLRKNPYRYLGNFKPKTEFKKDAEKILLVLLCENQEVFRTVNYVCTVRAAGSYFASAQNWHGYYIHSIEQYQKLIQQSVEIKCEGILDASN